MQHSFENGKYTVTLDEATGKLLAYRHGEQWRDVQGDGLVLAMLQEVDSLKASKKWSPRKPVIMADNKTPHYGLVNTVCDTLYALDFEVIVHMYYSGQVACHYVRFDTSFNLEHSARRYHHDYSVSNDLIDRLGSALVTRDIVATIMRAKAEMAIEIMKS